MDAPETNGADDYERKYMDGTQSLARSKQRMPGWFFGLMAVSLLLSVGASLATGSLSGLLSIVPIAFVTLLFSHLRLVVTEQNMHVQYGLFGPTIPHASITKITAEKYDWKLYGGWGLRYGRDGSVAYSTPGHGADCVRVVWRDNTNRERTTVVTCDDAQSIVRAVEQARAAKGMPALTGVRVDAPAATTNNEIPWGLPESADRKETTAEVDVSRVRTRKSA